MGCNFGIICRPTGFLKIIQIVIGIICIALLRGYAINWGAGDTFGALDRRLFGVTTIGGMLLVTIPTFIAYLLGEVGIEKTMLEILQNVCGAIMYIATGAMAIDTYKDLPKTDTRDAGLALGALSLGNALAYTIDAFFAYRNKRGI